MAPSCLLYLCVILMVRKIHIICTLNRKIHILDIKSVCSGIVGRSFSRTFVTIVAQLFYVDAGSLLFLPEYFFTNSILQFTYMFSWITITWTRWSFIIVWNVCSEWSPLMSPCQVLQQPSPQVRLTKLLKYCQQTQCLNLKKELNTWNENAVCYLVNSQPVGWKTTYGIQNTQRSIFKNLIASPLILSFLRSDGRGGEVTGLRGDVDTIRLLVATHFSSWLCISKQNGQCL